MGDRKKIVCVSHSTLMGGAECAFFEMVQALHTHAGYDVVGVFPVEVQEGGLIEKCAPYLHSSYTLRLPWWFGFSLPVYKRIKLIAKIILSSWAIRKIIRRSGAESVIVNTIAIPSAALGGFLARKKVHWFIHELGNDGFSLILGEPFSKRCIGRLSSFVLCNSQYIKKAYEPFINVKKMTVVNQSVDIAPCEREHTSSFLRVGIVGRLLPQKAQRFVVEAIFQMVGKGYDVHLYLIGADTTSYGESLKAYVQQKQAQTYVHFMGVVHPITQAYKQLDVLVSAGKNEALGRTTIEAMKMGIPVVVLNNYGHAELVQPKITGLIFEEDKVDDLVEQLIYLVNDTERKRIGEAGQQWANRHFSPIQFATQLKNIIDHD